MQISLSSRCFLNLGLLASLFGFGVSSVHAIDQTKANNATALNVASSYTSGTAPGANDLLIVNSVLASNRSVQLGANLSWKGIQVTNPNGGLTIGSTGTTNSLTLGSGGISVANGTVGSLTISTVQLIVGDNQSWSVAADKTLSIGTASTGVGSIVSGTGQITKDGGGTLLLNSTINTSGGFVLNSGTVQILGLVTTFGTGTLSINGGVLSSANTGSRIFTSSSIKLGGDFTLGNVVNDGQITFSGTMDLGGATRQINLASDSVGDVTKYTFGSGTVVPSAINSGTLSLQTDQSLAIFRLNSVTSFNGHSGLTIGNKVIVYTGAANALGDSNGTSARVTVEAGGTLDLSDRNLNSRNNIVYSQAGSGTVTNGDTTVGSNNSILTVDGTAGTTTFGGIIRDGSIGIISLTKTGSSTQILTGSNTYTGVTTLNSNAGTLMLGNGTTSGSIVSTVAVGANSTLALNPGATNLIYGGTISGAGRVTKTGANTATLNGINTYTGTTFVSGGKLVVGSAGNATAAIGAVQVSGAGSELGGIGTVGETTIGAGSALAPGNSVGTINTGNLSIDGTYAFELDSILVTADQVNVTGTVTLGAGSLFSGADLGNVTLSLGQSFIVINNNGVDLIVGFFSNLVDGGLITIGSTTFEANYFGGTGNDLALTAVVPEPSTVTLSALGLVGMAALLRRRRRMGK